MKLHLCVAVLLGCLMSCAPDLPENDGNPVPTPSPGAIANKWGSYTGPIKVQFLHPRNMRVIERVAFNDPTGKTWIAKVGDEFNGASIPQPVWSLIGGPFDDAYRDASLFHDLAYQRKTSSWQDADRMFYYSMRCSGVADWKAKLMFTAVWKGSTKWPEPGTANQTVFDRKSAMRVRTIPVEQLTREDVRAMEQWIRSENPSLAEIEAKFAPTSTGAPPLEDTKALLSP